MKHFLRQNGLLLLIIALLLSVLIGIVSAVMGGNADPLSNAVGFITTPIRNGVSAVLDWADGVRAYVFHYEEMEQQIQDLERQVAELEEQAREEKKAILSTDKDVAQFEVFFNQGQELANKMRGLLLKVRGREDSSAAQGMTRAIRSLAEAIGRCAE